MSSALSARDELEDALAEVGDLREDDLARSALLPVESAAPAPPSDPSLGAKVRRGAMWSAINTILLRFANLAIMAVVAHELSISDFGVFAVAMTVYSVIGCLAELGVTACLLRADVDMRKVAPTVSAIALISCSVLALAMFFFAEPFAAAAGSAHAAGTLRIMSVCIFMVGIFAVPAAEVARNFRQDQQFLATLIGFIPGNALLLVLAMHGGDATAFAWSRIVTQLLGGIALTIMAPNFYWPRIDRSQLRFIIFFGLPLAGANVLNFILLNADYAFVGRLLGTVELGTYLLAFTISSWSSNLLSSTVNGVSMTAFSHVKDDPVRFEASLARATAAIAVVAAPICGLTFALAPDLVVTVYGARWSAASHVLAILSLYGALSVYCLLLANVLSGTARTGALFLVQVAWLAALVPVMALGVHLGGIVGAAWAHVVIVCLVAVPVYLAMLRRSSPVRLTPMARAIVPSVAAAAVSTLGCLLVRTELDTPLLRLLVGGCVGGGVYVLLILPHALSVLGRSARLPKAVARPVQSYQAFLNRVGHLDRYTYRPSHRRGPVAVER